MLKVSHRSRFPIAYFHFTDIPSSCSRCNFGKMQNRSLCESTCSQAHMSIFWQTWGLFANGNLVMHSVLQSIRKCRGQSTKNTAFNSRISCDARTLTHRYFLIFPLDASCVVCFAFTIIVLYCHWIPIERTYLISLTILSSNHPWSCTQHPCLPEPNW